MFGSEFIAWIFTLLPIWLYFEFISKVECPTKAKRVSADMLGFSAKAVEKLCLSEWKQSSYLFFRLPFVFAWGVTNPVFNNILLNAVECL